MLPTRSKPQNENELFVSGIPIDLDQRGLMNLFSKAGPVDRAKIVAPKQETATNTFGFVSFKTKMAAQTAITMFDGQKCGNCFLKVKMNESAASKPPLPQSNAAFGAEYRPRQNSRGRESSDNDAVVKVNGNFDLSRPYAKLLFERIKVLSSKLPAAAAADDHQYADSDESRSSQNTIKSATPIDLNNNQNNNNNNNNNSMSNQLVNNSKPNADNVDTVSSVSTVSSSSHTHKVKLADKLFKGTSLAEKTKINQTDKLEIGKTYAVQITNISTPWNFFVQLKSSQSKTGNLMNNLNNHYINEDTASKGYFEVERGSIRCKMGNVRPKNNSWDEDTITILKNVAKDTEITTEIRVLGREPFEPENGRHEFIYLVDLVMDGEETLNSCLVECGLAIQQLQESQQTSSITVHGDGAFKPAATESVTTKTSSAADQADEEVARVTESMSKNLKIADSVQQVKKANLIESHALNDMFFGSDIKVKGASIHVENVNRPIHICLAIDTDKRDQLMTEINDFYADAKNLIAAASCDDIKLFNYYSIQSLDDQWYRVQVKEINKEKKLVSILYIDYGFEEQLGVDDLPRLIVLNERFYQYPRYSFGSVLVEKAANDSREIKPLLLNEMESLEEKLTEKYQEFFGQGDENLDVVICKRFENDSLTDFGFKRESYYGVYLKNAGKESLNELILDCIEKAKKKKKVYKPDLVRMSSKDMKSVNYAEEFKEDDLYGLFVQRVDLFYAYNLQKVTIVQPEVSKIVDLLVDEEKKFDSIDESDENASELKRKYLPELGNLVYGKYEDEWFRCVVTNLDHKKGIYELFYIDYGNTEIVNLGDIIYGWQPEHMKPFTDCPPAAIKCRLYGAASPVVNGSAQFSDEINKEFVLLCKDKTFQIDLVAQTKDDVCEVSMNMYDDELTSKSDMEPLKTLLRKKLVQIPLLKEIASTKSKLSFYSECLNFFKLENVNSD